jgi:NADP-dependent 3-hydroxy acid dehydrogenase YdfG
MQRDMVAYEGRDYRSADFLQPETVAAVIANVIATPPDGDVHEVVIRPASR